MRRASCRSWSAPCSGHGRARRGHGIRPPPDSRVGGARKRRRDLVWRVTHAVHNHGQQLADASDDCAVIITLAFQQREESEH